MAGQIEHTKGPLLRHSIRFLRSRGNLVWMCVILSSPSPTRIDALIKDHVTTETTGDKCHSAYQKFACGSFDSSSLKSPVIDITTIHAVSSLAVHAICEGAQSHSHEMVAMLTYGY